jgi:cell fate (sporulation/competence/biofilm development) regulator YlbF (YheA/YmcA/DUF963 family)
MEDLIAQARELGRRIAAHPRTVDFLAAARSVAEDRDAQQILRDYQEQIGRIRELEGGGRPIEPQDKRRLAELEQRVAANEKLKQMMRLEADYLEMMHRVNAAIDDAAQAAGG